MTGTNPRISVEVEATTGKLTTQLNAASKSIQDFGNKTRTSMAGVGTAFDNTSKNVWVGGNKYVQVNERMAEAAAAAAKAQRLQTATMNVATTSTTAFTGGLTKAFSGLRTLAYILPGLGIAGIFNIAYEALTPLVNKLFEAAKATKALRDSQLELNDVRIKGLQDAQKELVSAGALYRASQNQNLSLEERKKAVDLLQEQYPKYFKNLSDEQILAGNAATAYGQLKDSIIALAYAKAAEDAISQKATQNLKLSYDFAVKQAAINRLLAEKSRLDTQGAPGEGVGLSPGQVRAVAIEKEINDKLKEQNEIRGQVRLNLAVINGLTKQIDQSVVEGGISVLGFKDATDKATTSVIALRDAQDLGRAAGLPGQKNIWGQASVQIASQQKEAFANLPEIVQPVAEKTGEVFAEEFVSPFESVFPLLQTNFETFFNDILMNGKLSFESLGQAIINSFTSVLASEAAQGIIGLLKGGGESGKGGLIKGIGKLLGGGAGAGILGTVLPIAGMALGAVAIGSALFKKRDRAPDPVMTTATGGQTFQGTFNGGVVQFEIAGTKLIGVLNNTGYALSRVQNRRI